MTDTNGRAKRLAVESRDLIASKRRRTTEDEIESLFVTDSDEGVNEDTVQVTEPDSDGNWSQTANIRDRVNGRSNLNTVPFQARSQVPAANPPTPASVPSTKANSVSFQQKTATQTNGTTSTKKKAGSNTEVKEDPEKPNMPAWIEGTEEINRIRIYIGKRQRQTFARREDISKSSVLTGYIVEDAEQGAYIMRPQLLRTDPNDFDAVLQFIHTGTFEPLVIQDKDNGGLFKGITSDLEYGRELVRLGKIYVIAQMFKVDALEDAIYDKICAINARRFPNKALVELAGVIFNDKRVSTRPGNAAVASAESSQTVQDEKDKFEGWIVNKIATNFQDIQKYQHDDFWVVEKKTTKKMFYARVLELAAEIYRANSGKLPGPTSTIVELD